jgi:hypothetical protein
MLVEEASEVSPAIRAAHIVMAELLTNLEDLWQYRAPAVTELHGALHTVVLSLHSLQHLRSKIVLQGHVLQEQPLELNSLPQEWTALKSLSRSHSVRAADEEAYCRCPVCLKQC